MDGSTEAKEEDSAAGKSTKVSGEVTASNQDGLLRENMVDLATRFLTNNRVQTSPMEQRRAFLKKKGKLFNYLELIRAYFLDFCC